VYAVQTTVSKQYGREIAIFKQKRLTSILFNFFYSEHTVSVSANESGTKNGLILALDE
jgi:hypothetical protein